MGRLRTTRPILRRLTGGSMSQGRFCIAQNRRECDLSPWAAAHYVSYRSFDPGSAEHGGFIREIGLSLRRRQCRRHRGHEDAARRQGRQSGRNGAIWPAGSAGLHHHHRSLHRLLRERPAAIPTASLPKSRRRWREVEQARRRAVSAIRKTPLLVSVRSGARVSMPGMMDTVLNLGLNDATVEGLARAHRRSALRL